MRLGQDVLCDLRAALATEWLLANGIGGSASGTAAGAHTRRGHALLLAADPHGRLTTLLLKLDERLHVAGAGFELGCNLVAGGEARPAGHLLLESFTCDPWPAWVFRAGEVALEKSVLAISGHNAVAIRYRHLEGPEARLTLSPLIVARDPGALQSEDPGLHPAVQGMPGRVRIEVAAERTALTLWHNGSFLPARVWLRGLEYPADREAAGEGPGARGGARKRGRPRGAGRGAALEDALIPGYIEATLNTGSELHVVAAAEADLFRALAREDRLGEIPPRSLAECVAWLERGERQQLDSDARLASAGADQTAREAGAARSVDAGAAAPREAGLEAGVSWTGPLAATLLSGLTRRGLRLTLVGTLPVAPERGADALRMVPALVSLRAFELARAVLRDCVEYLDEGLAPASFDPLDGTPRYGDPAAALWLVHAAELYVRRSEDLELAKQTLVPALEGVMQFYRAGTRHGIRVDSDGLLAAGEPATKRADLNALWYHALVAMAQLGRSAGRKESAAFYLAWAREHQARFNAAFWDEAHGALYEALDGERPVPGLSPSQLLAVRLPPPLLAPERALALVTSIERELWTPLGLREAPGGTRAHTAWLGAFYAATLRVHQRTPEAQAGVGARLDALRPALERGVHGVPPEWFEVPRGGASFDVAACGRGGDPVSVLAAAELLQLWVEELDHAGSAVAAPV